jgi:hypothetical protein
MFRKLAMVLGLALLAAALQATGAGNKPLAPAVQWISPNAVVALELTQPKALLDLLLDPKLAETITSLPVYQKQASQPGFKQFLGVIAYLESTLGTDWRTGVRRLLGGGITLAILPDDTFLLAVDSEDPQLLQQLHETILGFAKGDAAKEGDPDRIVSEEYRAVTAWRSGPKEAHAIVENRLLLTNRLDVIKAVLDLRAEPNSKNLAGLPVYRAAKEAAGADAAATVFVHLKALTADPAVQQALSQSPNPMATLLLAELPEVVRESSWLAIGLRVEGNRIAFQASVDGKMADPGGPTSFALPSQPDEGVLPNLSVPRRIAGLSFYRDLHKFYGAKDNFFPERTSGLIFFENMMGIFFTGRDLTEEVWGETRPEIRLVVAEQEYDPSLGTPQVQIPSFAVIFRLRQPERFSEVVEEAWQKAVGLVNFTRGQQAQPGLIIDRPVYGETKLSVAYFSSAQEEKKTGRESRYNFRPALARLDQYLILSSTDGLTRDLLDALKKEIANPVKPLTDSHTLAEVDVVQLASILRANRENLILDNMLKKGNPREQAETEIDLLTTILNYLGQAKLNFGSQHGRVNAGLELRLNLP